MPIDAPDSSATDPAREGSGAFSMPDEPFPPSTETLPKPPPSSREPVPIDTLPPAASRTVPNTPAPSPSVLFDATVISLPACTSSPPPPTEDPALSRTFEPISTRLLARIPTLDRDVMVEPSWIVIDDPLGSPLNGPVVVSVTVP